MIFNPLIILLFHFLIYGIPPILIARYIKKFKSMALFYAYFGFLFVFTQLFAVFYAIRISEDLLITGGNIAFSSLILLTFSIGIITNDPVIVRNLIIIEILLNIFLFFLYLLLFTVLNTSGVINIFNVSPEIFSVTITVNIASLIVFTIEVLIMFSVLEKIKNHIKNIPFLFFIFIWVFIGILCLDGFLFPFIMNFFEPELGTAITGGILGKFILGLGYSPFLLVFLIIYREDIKEYLKEPFHPRYIIVPPKKSLIEELEQVEQDLKESEEKYYDAFNRANFYKDLFTHDISNVIQNIELSSELYKNYRNAGNNISSEKFEELHGIMNRQINSAKKLISNINKLSTLNEGKLKLKPINLFESLSKSIEDIEENYHQKEVFIKVEPFKNDFEVKADEFIFDVFENILINAVKYNENTPPQIIVSVSKVYKENISMIKIEFKDNGIGILDNMKEKIFQKGYKKLKGAKGMGLGLSLVAKIIELYNGKIWVEDKVKDDYSKGSNFVILVPEA